SLVEEFGGTIWPTGPRQRGNGVDHHPQLVCRCLPDSVYVSFCVGVHTLSSFRQTNNAERTAKREATIAGKRGSHALRHVRSLLCFAPFFMERLCVLTLPLLA